MNDRSRSDLGTHQSAASTAPILTAAGVVLTGAGFLPDHEVTVRIVYTAEDVTDYLTYTTDARGCLHAELPTSPSAGALQIIATDHRTDPDGVCGLLWSNVQTVGGRTGRG